jgi:hypothetical protein
VKLGAVGLDDSPFDGGRTRRRPPPLLALEGYAVQPARRPRLDHHLSDPACETNERDPDEQYRNRYLAARPYPCITRYGRVLLALRFRIPNQARLTPIEVG